MKSHLKATFVLTAVQRWGEKMKLIIDIPNWLYADMKEYKHPDVLDKAILNGVPLPKGHGRLIDADDLMKLYGFENATKYGNKTAEQQTYSYDTMMMYEIRDMIDDAPTIIPADKESEKKR